MNLFDFYKQVIIIMSDFEYIRKLTEEIEDSEKELKEAYVNKATNEEYNSCTRP